MALVADVMLLTASENVLFGEWKLAVMVTGSWPRMREHYAVVVQRGLRDQCFGNLCGLDSL